MERFAADDGLHALVDEFFLPGPTADVGSGEGERTAWLHRHGFTAVGFEADEALLEAARRAHPELDFAHAILPALAGIPEAEFVNVMCANALTTLDDSEIDGAVTRLLDILRPGGTLLLSVPATPDGLTRETILHEDEAPTPSGALARRIVARKHGGR